MTSRFALPTACLGLLLLGSACQEHDFKTCDITQRACQEDIYYRMLSLRGDGYDPFGGLPPVGVISEDDFRAMLVQEQASQSNSGASPWDSAMALLHFTSSGSSGPDAGAGGDAGSGGSTLDDQVAHTYAFYSPTTKTVTIIKHPPQPGDTYAQENAMVTLAHELVHAMQDRELDLKKEDFTTTDEYFAYDAIIEGDARLYEYLFTNAVRGLLKHPALDVVAMPTSELDDIYGTFADQATPMFLARLLVYPLGAKYEALEYQSGGNAAVRHGYSKEPHHMVGFLVGDDGRAPAVSSGSACPGLYASSLPTQGKTTGADQFGALMFYSFLRGWKVDHQTAFATAQAWTGDYLFVQASADLGTTAVSWRVEFSSPPQSTIAQALSATRQLSITPGTQSLQITATDSRTPLTWKPLANCP